jgi:solute carrier family 8 (sodium/calcium exchanger)
MALGSSSPEILLSVIEIFGNNFQAGELGPGTIVGSAAYNLLVITAICVVAIDSPGVRRIKNFKVFLTTAAYASFAYIWLFLVLVVITPNQVTLWEAIVTLLCFPLLVVNSYMAEKNFFLKTSDVEEEVKQLVDLCKLKCFRINKFCCFFLHFFLNFKRLGNVNNSLKDKLLNLI